jgi:predicted dithiol-disulfide oxidoreductase (DUF899 family)
MPTNAASLYTLEEQLAELEGQVFRARAAVKDCLVQDFAFADWDGGETRLSELFGERESLIVIHNMGVACRYCTMWADGINGLLPYLERAAAVAMVSHDPVAHQKEVSEARGWRFRMYDASRTRFFADMGFYDTAHGGLLPGTSTFVRGQDGSVLREAIAYFGPGDRFCPTFSFLDLLKPEVRQAFVV